MVAKTDLKARLFDLWGSVVELVRGEKRSAEGVARVLQVIKDRPDFEQALFPSATGPKPRKTKGGVKAQKAARLIMGKNFLGIEEVEQRFGVRFSEKELAQLAEIPWSEQELLERKDTHILFPGYPLTILDIRDKAPKGAFYPYENAWYNNQNFARNKKVNLCWYLIRKQAVKGSFGKSYNEQAQLLNENEEVPKAVEVVYMTILYYLVNNIRLFEDCWVRCQDLDSYGCRVYVGCFGRDGLCIFDDWDDYRDSCIGLAVSRKLNK